MTPDPRKVEALFGEALELAPVDRAGFLKEACDGDEALLAAVLKLLSAHESEDNTGFLPAFGTSVEPQPVSGEQPGTVIGHYMLREKIGEGAFGFVWVAEQSEPVRRLVALKILKPGMDSREIVARFEAERQALALMQHPNIAAVFDAGTTERGRPFFVMELVRGVPVTEFCDLNSTPAVERLQLFIKICRAVQHAHQKGVIHRDIKPSNILVTLHDGEPVPKVIDFGIAKALGASLTDHTLYTGFHQLIGTPTYMSPEQAEMSGLDVDTRSDVYSLGVLLYELLTGTTPIERDELRRAAMDEIIRAIREREPARPSTRLSTLREGERVIVAGRRGLSPRGLVALLQGDLDWIAIKALEKDRTRRYETAADLAADIERHLAHQPVAAHKPGRLYRATKFVRRHRLVVALSSAIALATLAGLIASTLMFLSERKERARAEAAEHEQSVQRKRAETGERRAQRLLYAADMNLADQSLAVNNIGRVRFLLDRHRPKPGEADLRGWEWRYLWSQARRGLGAPLTDHDARVGSLEFSPDGRRLAVAYWDGSVELWRTSDWKLDRVVEKPRTDEVLGGARFSADSRHLFTTGDIGEVREHDLISGGVRILRSDREDFVRDISMSPDGNLFTVVARDIDSRRRSPPALVFDTASGKVVAEHPLFAFDNHFGAMRVSRDDKRLFVAGGIYSDARVSCVTLPDWKPVWEIPMEGDRGFSALELSPDGRFLLTATGYNGSTISVWEAATGRYVDRLEGHSEWVEQMAFSPDGKLLATASADQTARLWNTETWSEVAVLRGHGSSLQSVAFSPDGRTLVTGDADGVVMKWDVASVRSETSRNDIGGSFITAHFLPDSHTLLTSDNKFRWALFDLDTSTKTDLPFDRATQVGRDIVMAWDEDPRHPTKPVDPHKSDRQGWIRWPDDHPHEITLQKVSPSGAKEILRMPVAEGFMQWGVVSEDSQWFAWVDEPGTIKVIRLADPENRIVLRDAPAGAMPVAFCDDNRYVAAFSNESIGMTVWDVTSGKIVGGFPTTKEAWPGFWYASPSKPLLVCFPREVSNGRVVFHRLDQPDAKPVSLRPLGSVLDLAVSRDKTLLATANETGRVGLYDLTDFREVAVMEGSALAADAVAFSPDGTRLVITGEGRNSVILRDVATRQELMRLDGRDQAGAVEFSDDGTIIMSRSISRATGARIWRAPTLAEIESIEAAGGGW